MPLNKHWASSGAHLRSCEAYSGGAVLN